MNIQLKTTAIRVLEEAAKLAITTFLTVLLVLAAFYLNQRIHAKFINSAFVCDLTSTGSVNCVVLDNTKGHHD